MPHAPCPIPYSLFPIQSKYRHFWGTKETPGQIGAQSAIDIKLIFPDPMEALTPFPMLHDLVAFSHIRNPRVEGFGNSASDRDEQLGNWPELGDNNLTSVGMTRELQIYSPRAQELGSIGIMG